MNERRTRPAPRHLESTPALERTCPACAALTLEAVEEGIPVRLDPEPLPDVDAEIAARLAGRRTYNLYRCREVAYRDQYRIRRRDYPVLADHECRKENAK